VVKIRVSNPGGNNPLMRQRVLVRMMLKLILNVLGYGGVTLILFTKRVAFLLRWAKFNILI
jgi:hypothetical protein